MATFPESSIKGSEGICGNDGLFGCFKDMDSCLVSCCCPCFGAFESMEIVGENPLPYGLFQLICCECYSCLGAVRRYKLRKAFGGPQKPSETNMLKDCCLYCWCGECAIAQEVRLAKAYRNDHAPAKHTMEDDKVWPESDFAGSEGCFGNDGLFGCFKDPKNCCLACLCPCYVGWRYMEALGDNGVEWEGSYCLVTTLTSNPYGGNLGWMVAAMQRNRIKDKFGAKRSFCWWKESLATICCGCCTLCQEDRIIRKWAESRAPEQAQPLNGSMASTNTGPAPVTVQME